MDEPPAPTPLPTARPVSGEATGDAERIADQLELLVDASGWLSSELTRIMTCRALLTQVTVNRLVALGERMRPAAAARDRLARIEPDRLLAGGAVWLARQHAARIQESAAIRAARVWAGGAA